MDVLLDIVAFVGHAIEAVLFYVESHHWIFGLLALGCIFYLHDRALHARFDALEKRLDEIRKRLAVAVVARLVEQIRFAVSDTRTWLPSGETTTVSIGMASLGHQPCTLADLVKRADAALYAAKSGGRNQVVNWSDIAQGLRSRESDKPIFLAR
jgi:hypothetical protein